MRGAFEYQGQKCSAASRAYLPASIWRRLEADLVAEADALAMGDVRDLTNFMGAVIDGASYARLRDACARADDDPTVHRLTARTVSSGPHVAGSFDITADTGRSSAPSP